MLRHSARCCVITTLAPLLTGCGTLMNLRSMETARALPDSTVPRAAVYGGVKLDAAAGRRSFDAAPNRPAQALVGAYVWGIDLPISVVADTLTLPVTVPASIRREVNEYYFPEVGSTTADQTMRTAKAPLDENRR
jgi:uncharacterized protein YceK